MSPGHATRMAPPRAPAAARGGGTLSGASADRFAARVRRRRRQRMGIVVAAVAVGLGLGWLLFASPVFAVREIAVRGARRTPAAQVSAIASGQLGRSMALAMPQTVADDVVKLPLVRRVRVDRSWPATLVVTVTEREPIAAVPATGAYVSLVDGDGVVVDTVPSRRLPAGLPLIDVDVSQAGAETLRAARAVADDVPEPLRAGLRRVRADSPDAVSFVLADGSTVVWGSAQDGDRKAVALLAVHPRLAKPRVVIDVSAPDAPAVTTRRR